LPSAAAGEVVVGQGAFEGGVVLLHEVEGGVDADGEVSLLGVLEELGPAGLLGQVEDVLHGVELDHVEVGLLALVDEFRPAGLELVGYELEKDEAEHHVLVLGGLDGAAQLVGGVPEGLLEAFGVLWWGRLGSHLQWGGRRTERVECNTLQGLELFDKNSFRPADPGFAKASFQGNRVGVQACWVYSLRANVAFAEREFRHANGKLE